MKPQNILLIGIVIIALLISASCGGKRNTQSPFREQPPEQPASTVEGEQPAAAATNTGEVNITLPLGVAVNPVSFVVSGQFAYFTDPTYGLVLIDMLDPTKLNIVAWDGIAAKPPTDLEVAGGYAYIGIGDGGIAVVDVDPLAEASVVASIADQGSVGKFMISGNFIYSADRNNGMKIIDITDPLNPVLKNSVAGSFYSVDAADGYAYLATGPDGLTIVDVDPPEDAAIVTTVPTVADGSAVDVKVLGGYAYLATGNNGGGKTTEPSGFEVINVTPPENAAVVHTVATTGDFANKIILFEGFAYAWSGNDSVEVINISNPAEASITSSFANWSNDKKIATFDKLMFALQYVGGLKISALTSD
ncbi:MAG: hypothetical protein NTY09_03900 [bacterium]|nr:hypothetical protein [bacterium]